MSKLKEYIKTHWHINVSDEWVKRQDEKMVEKFLHSYYYQEKFSKMIDGKSIRMGTIDFDNSFNLDRVFE